MSAVSPNMEAILRWDVRNWSRAVEFWDRNLPNDISGQTALEIGAGEGGLSLYLASRGCMAICTDYGRAAAKAMEHHAAHGLGDLVDYARTDAAHLPFPDATFDVAAFKSVLGGIGRHGGLDGQKRTINELHRVLRPGGMVIFADNLRATPIHQFIRRTFVPWGHDWRYPDPEEFREFFSQFAGCEIRTFGVMAALGRSERQRAILHYLDCLLSPLVSARARYIGYGFAIK